jgi:hypothetical protein
MVIPFYDFPFIVSGYSSTYHCICSHSSLHFSVPAASQTKISMSVSTTTSSSMGAGQGQPQMDKRLLKAATSGDSISMKAMAEQDPSILLGTTPSRNTCLHISSIHGHGVFCTDVVAIQESLLMAVNLDEETPLIAAVRSGCVPLASSLLRRCQPGLREVILQKDKNGFNALHHAIRNGHKDLALELITAEPALSQAVSKNKDSPLFFAVMRNYKHLYDKLMQNPDCAYSGGPDGHNCLHAAVKKGDKGQLYISSL